MKMGNCNQGRLPCTCKTQTAEQHQGEPVAQTKDGTHCRICGTKLCVRSVCTIYCPNRDCGVPGVGTKQLNSEELTRLKAGVPVFENNPGASCAVVLPARKPITAHGLSALDSEAEGWNACITEVENLNSVKTKIPARPVGQVVGRRMEGCRFKPKVDWADDIYVGRIAKGTKLYTHPDSGEVERLRKDRDDLQRYADELNGERCGFETKIASLHAQLAERDALLADASVLARFTLPEAWHALYSALGRKS